MAGKEKTKQNKKHLTKVTPLTCHVLHWKNKGDRRADGLLLQTPSLSDLSFPIQVVIIRTKHIVLPTSEADPRLDFIFLSSLSPDNFTKLLSVMNEMYSCFRDTAAVLNTDIHGYDVILNTKTETKSSSRCCLRMVLFINIQMRKWDMIAD